MKRGIHAAILALGVASLRVAAAGGEPIALLEARVGAPPDPDPVMDTVRAEFEREGFAVTRAAIEYAFAGRFPAPGIADPALSALEALQRLDEGFQLYVNADYGTAEAKLKVALLGVRLNPALLASDTKNLEPIFRAMSALALSQKRLKKTEAKLASLHELVRAFPHRPLSRDDFGPADVEDYKAVAKATNAKPRGQLRVEVDDPRVEVFVDGQMRGMGKVEIADLVPGIYRVFLRTSSRTEVGRTYAIEVEGGQEARLVVSWEVDARFSTIGPWTGLELPGDADGTRELARDAAVIAGWTLPGLVAVVERVQVAGKPALDATLYRTDRVAVHHHRVMLDGDLAAKARELARALRDAVGAPAGAPTAASASPARDRGGGEPAGAWHAAALEAGGVALMAAAATIDATIEVTATRDRGSHLALERGALAGFAIGSALVGAGMYIRARAARADRVAATAAGIGVGLLATGTFALITSQATPPAFGSSGLATAGAVGAVAGAAALGASLWLASRPDGVVVGIASSF